MSIEASPRTVPETVLSAVSLRAVEMVRVLDGLVRTETVRVRHIELVRAREHAQALSDELAGITRP
jgi:hypothetical protein